MFREIRAFIILTGADSSAFEQIEKFEDARRSKTQSNWIDNCVLRGEDSGGGCGQVTKDHPFLKGKLRDECTLEFAPYLGINCFPSVSGPE
jgi:hypothetical protein